MIDLTNLTDNIFIRIIPVIRIIKGHYNGVIKTVRIIGLSDAAPFLY